MFKSITISIIVFLEILIYTGPAIAQSQGPFSSGTQANHIAGGSVAWVNPHNAAATDNTYAVATNGISNFLKVSNFGFSIPLTATITGIVAEVERKAAPVSPVVSDTWATFSPALYASGTATANYGSTSYSYNLPVSSATNNQRLIVVTIGIENVDNIAPSDPSLVFGTVTYNGVAMTLATSNFRASATTSNNVAVYYLTESGLPATTGSRVLVVNKTINGELAGETISPAEYVEVIGINTFTNVNQANPIMAVSQNTATSPITSPAINDLRNGDYLVAATMNNTSFSGSASVTEGAGYTENFEISLNNSGSTSGAILEVQSKSLAGLTGIPGTTVTATAAGASRLVMGAISVNAARVYDNSVMLTTPLGMQTGTSQAISPANLLSNAWPDVDTYQTYGGSTNLWGATWSPVDINSSNFGLSFQSNGINGIASVDDIKITVYYSVSLNVAFNSFSVSQTNEEVISTFSYSIEENEKYQFILEKAGEDFIFQPVDTIYDLGKHTIQNLTIKDANPYRGINYYRIKADNVNQGLSTRYSSIQQIIFGEEQKTEVLVYPNPVVNYVMIESYQKIRSVTIVDATGNSFSFPINSWDSNTCKLEGIGAKGICTLIVTTDSGNVHKKILID